MSTHNYPRLKFFISWVLLMVFTLAVLWAIKGNAAPSPKYDGDCTGNEIIGRCADKGCQYPDRSTNPPGGCDNTDPCDPKDAAAGGSGKCCDIQYCEPENVTTQNVSDTELPQFQEGYGERWGK